MRSKSKRFPEAVRFLALMVVLLLASYRSQSEANGGPCSATGNETLEAAARHYQPGEIAVVSGSGYQPSCNLTVGISGPAGTSSVVSTDSGGNLSYSYRLGNAAGDYTATATFSDDLSMSAAFTNGGYIEPDMPDYAPGNRVTLKGSLWMPGETVAITIHETDGPDGDVLSTSVADSAGNFTNGAFFTNEQDLGVHFLVTAVGQSSGYTVQTTFADGFQATSRATGNWSDDATWSITRPGTISWTNGSNAITGSGTGGQNFLTDLAVGNVITTTADTTVIGTVAGIIDATHLTLASNVTLATAGGQTYKARRAPAATDDAVIQRVAGGTVLTVTLDGSFSANTLTINGSGTAPAGGGTLTIPGSQSLTVAGAVTLSSGAGSNGGTATLNISAGTLNAGSFVTGNSTNSGNITLTTGTLKVSGNATIAAGGSTGASVLLNLNSGAFQVGGNLTVGGATGGKIVSPAAGGTIQVTGRVAINGAPGKPWVEVGPATLTAGNLQMTGGGNGAATATLFIGTGSATFSGDLTSLGGAGARIISFNGGTGIQAGPGTLSVGGTFGDGFTLTNYTTAPGSTVQFHGPNFGFINAYTYQNLTVSKTGAGLALLNGNVLANGPVTVLSGTFDHGAYSVTAIGGVSVGAGGTYSDVGGGDLLLGAGLANAGTVQINGSTADCGEDDTISITSTVAGTQRSWSGAGTFDIADVIVKDQGGTAVITALSSTNGLGNGPNWIIKNDCILDSTPPETSIGSAPADPTNSASAGFVFTGSDDLTPTASLAFECKLDAAAFSACASPASYAGLAEGSHTFQVRAKDLAGNIDSTPASFTWTIDTTPPDTTVTSGPTNPTNSQGASFAFSSSEAGSSFQCRLDGGPYASCTSPTPYSGLSEASHTFEVKATDKAGNVDPTPASFTWVVDITAPDTTIGTAPPSCGTSNSATLTFSASEGATFQCSLDGGAWAACASPASYPGLAEGAHSFAVKATDAAGNTDPSAASANWTVDATAPDTTIGSGPANGSTSNSASASFSFGGSDNVAPPASLTFECRLDAGSFAACASPASYSGLSDSSHTFSVRAVDPCGNTDATPDSRTWTVDTTPPDTTITGNPSNPTNSGSASFNFTSTESGGTFQCQLDGGGFSACASSKSYSGLSAGNHGFQVRATDAAGNTDATPASYSWTINGAPFNVSAAAAPGSLSENDTATLNGSFSDSNDSGQHTVTIAWGDGSANTVLTVPAGTFAFSAAHQYLDDSPTATASDVNNISATVTDSGGLSASGGTSITVNNAAPVITGITGPIAPIAMGAPAALTAGFTDAGTKDTHSCTFDWRDATTSGGTIDENAGTCTASHTYAAAGVYQVLVTVNDDDTGSVSMTYANYVVIYDAGAGFVTGGGWINSPAGAMPGNPTATGKANYGISSKYQNGKTVPDGSTEFQFKTGNLNFKSTSYEWLVISGGYKAQYKGHGTINGSGAYAFILTAIDGTEQGNGGQDKFRIKIYDENQGNAVIYDNNIGSPDTADPATVPGGGSIVIHK